MTLWSFIADAQVGIVIGFILYCRWPGRIDL